MQSFVSSNTWVLLWNPSGLIPDRIVGVTLFKWWHLRWIRSLWQRNIVFSLQGKTLLFIYFMHSQILEVEWRPSLLQTLFWSCLYMQLHFNLKISAQHGARELCTNGKKYKNVFGLGLTFTVLVIRDNTCIAAAHTHSPHIHVQANYSLHSTSHTNPYTLNMHTTNIAHISYTRILYISPLKAIVVNIAQLLASISPPPIPPQTL